MNAKFVFCLAIAAAAISFSGKAHAQAENREAELEELNPFSSDVEETLRKFDKAYEEQTGQASHINEFDGLDELFDSGCYRQTCHVWALVRKSEQRLHLYIDGNPAGEWLVSTGMAGRETPDFDRHPDGRIYDRYTSTKFPEGDYQGLGNMPYAVFISGGFALHGTPKGNWPKLGRPASHGCVRQHPDNAFRFNRLVRAAGIRNVWITVE